ncbi:HNH endonuclease [Mycolicibacterium fortuitum]|uniref:HNH endonuclease n=1 Tax=Mycolicibacterium fortuitum TaxID=1766 RepID=UPI00263797C7|nr:HNH endonuclease [Mycolicibacterium fortuitum]
MPRAPKYCGHQGCTTLVTGKSRCHDHSGWKTSPRTASAGRTSTAHWKQQRAKALQRDGHQCQIRGPRCTIQATQVDHIIPVSQGGTDDLTNLASACHNCHAAKTAREAAAARG